MNDTENERRRTTYGRNHVEIAVSSYAVGSCGEIWTVWRLHTSALRDAIRRECGACLRAGQDYQSEDFAVGAAGASIGAGDAGLGCRYRKGVGRHDQGHGVSLRTAGQGGGPL